ncbi:MAG: DUF3124 domain-containing protein [Bacteroidota bacterium]
MKNTFFFLLSFLILQSCIDRDPNLDRDGKSVFEENQIFLDAVDLKLRDTVYIPIYSDIYSESKDQRFYLTATLSIRNTSLTDSIFIGDIDYYDTEGAFVRHYIEKTLLLKPMQSIEYIIEKDDKVGGAGANFIVNWGANSKQVRPLFQGVMISTQGQQGISFLTEGVSISRKAENKAEPDLVQRKESLVEE